MFKPLAVKIQHMPIMYLKQVYLNYVQVFLYIIYIDSAFITIFY